MNSAPNRRPFVLSSLSPDEEKTYDDLAVTVAKELVVLKHQARTAPELLFDRNRGIVLRLYTARDAKEAILHPADLRARYAVTALADCVGTPSSMTA